MGGDTDDADAIQRCEGVVLELLGHCPGDQVTRGSDAALHVLLDRVLRNVTLETDLHRAQNIWKRFVILIDRSHQHEYLMSRGIR